MSRRLSTLLVALLLGVAAVASADYRQSFRKGIEAVEKENWAEARRWLEQAIQEEPTESTKNVKLYGALFHPYIPHYYLGLAHYRLGDCEAALRHWQISEQQGAIQKTKFHGDLVKNRDECRSQLPAKPAPTPTPRGPDPAIARAAQAAQAAIADAVQAETTASRLARDSAWGEDPALARELNRGSQTLEQARSALQRGQANAALAELEEATRLATRARQQLEALPGQLETVRQRLGEQEQTRLDQQRRQEQAVPPATPAPQSVAPTPTSSAEPTALIESQSVATPAPETLLTAVEAFLAGEYERADSLLASARFANRRVAAVAHLVRAASRWRLYRQGGSQDDALRQQIEADVRSCKTLDSSVLPDRDAFSPSFVTLFGGIG